MTDKHECEETGGCEHCDALTCVDCEHRYHYPDTDETFVFCPACHEENVRLDQEARERDEYFT